MYENKFYEDNKFDVYSQNGEDGVVQAILTRLDIQGGWVCEFGAWDGIFLSNTFALVEKGFKAVYIEGHQERFNNLQKTCYEFPNIIPVLSMVEHAQNSKKSLDKILTRTDIPHDFVLLSIDIDSFDYQVWQSVEKYRPRVVIVEINSSIIATRTDYIHQVTSDMQGTSFGAMLKLGLEKGYQLLAHTGNMIFIRDEDCGVFDIPRDPLTCFRTNWLP